ncbi:MAG: IS110 family transposase [Rhodospirillaceae bacterium]|nr:IS110 family transposase [Rhodospirillaceae bacterium]
MRVVSAQDVLKQFREPSITVAPGTAEAAVAHIQVIVNRLQLVARELSNAHRQMDRLTAAVGTPLENPGTGPGREPQRDVSILASLPGVGRTVLATLLSEALEPLRRRDYHALRCLCGVAPVTRSSGKSLMVKRRLAAHKRLQDAVYHWAGIVLVRDPLCKAKYAALRARGHGHARALRSIGDRLIAVACAMLTGQTEFDPNRSSSAA